METREQEILERLSREDPVLAALVEEHRHLDAQVNEMNAKPYLTTQEALEKKRLKKLKLAKKDQIEKVLAEARKES